jgi:hypothetical protein
MSWLSVLESALLDNRAVRALLRRSEAFQALLTGLFRMNRAGRLQCSVSDEDSVPDGDSVE